MYGSETVLSRKYHILKIQVDYSKFTKVNRYKITLNNYLGDAFSKFVHLSSEVTIT